MNIFLILALIIILFCSYLSNKIKQKAFAKLMTSDQEKILLLPTRSKFSILIFLVFLLVSIFFTVYPLSFLPSPFILFIVLMFLYIALQMFMKYIIQKNQQINDGFIYAGLQGNVIVLLGLLLFVIVYMRNGFVWA